MDVRFTRIGGSKSRGVKEAFRNDLQEQVGKTWIDECEHTLGSKAMGESDPEIESRSNGNNLLFLAQGKIVGKKSFSDFSVQDKANALRLMNEEEQGIILASIPTHEARELLSAMDKQDAVKEGIAAFERVTELSHEYSQAGETTLPYQHVTDECINLLQWLSFVGAKEPLPLSVHLKTFIEGDTDVMSSIVPDEH